MKIASEAAADETRLPTELLTPLSRRLFIPTPGYCCACGTWDMHVRRCASCGVDFDAQMPDDDEP